MAGRRLYGDYRHRGNLHCLPKQAAAAAHIVSGCFRVSDRGLALSLVTPTWPLFLGSRLLQAVGTGIFIPLMMSTVLVVAPKQKMGTYLSIGTVLAFAYALKRRRLARSAREEQAPAAAAEAAPVAVADTVSATAAGQD